MNKITAKNVLNQMPSVGVTLSNIPKWNQTNNGKYPSLSTSVKNLADAIPQAHANIQNIYDSGNTANPPVVLIQDVHLNPEAQTNIAAVLQALIDQNKLSLVGVEGSFTPFDFSNFRRFPDKEIARQVTESFLNKNLLAAPSFVGFTSTTKLPRFIGIDDRSHYEANVNAFLETRNLKGDVLDQIRQIGRELSEAKKRIFSKDLLHFDHIRTAYHKGSMDFGQYIKKLASYTSDHDLVLEQFLEAFKMESALDLERVERERKTVIEKLAKKLNDDEVSLLVAQSLAYRSGRLGFGSYYHGLKDLCQKKGIDLGRTRAFEDYIRYVLLSDGIKADELFESIGHQEKKVINNLAKSEKERELALISEQISLIEKLIDFSLTPNEWDSYRKNKYSLKEIAEQISILSNRHFLGINKIASLDSFETFYHEADIRSHKMVKKLVSYKSNGNRALVMGGFHAPQVAQILKQQEISHIILSPKVSRVDGSGSAYLTVFAKEKTPLDRIFAGEKLFVYPSYLGLGANPEAIPTGRLWWAVGAIENAVRNPSSQPIGGIDVEPAGETGEYKVQVGGMMYVGEHSLEGKGDTQGLRFVHTTIQDKKLKKPKVVYSILYGITHPITATFIETLGLWGTSYLANQIIAAAAFSDPTGITILAVVGIALIFSLLHGDLWGQTTYENGKITFTEFTNRFLQRFIGGTTLTAPILFIPGINGILTSGSIHLIWNLAFLLRKKISQIPFLRWLEKLLPLSIPKRIHPYFGDVMHDQHGAFWRSLGASDRYVLGPYFLDEFDPNKIVTNPKKTPQEIMAQLHPIVNENRKFSNHEAIEVSEPIPMDLTANNVNSDLGLQIKLRRMADKGIIGPDSFVILTHGHFAAGMAELSKLITKNNKFMFDTTLYFPLGEWGQDNFYSKLVLEQQLQLWSEEIGRAKTGHQSNQREWAGGIVVALDGHRGQLDRRSEFATSASINPSNLLGIPSDFHSYLQSNGFNRVVIITEEHVSDPEADNILPLESLQDGGFGYDNKDLYGYMQDLRAEGTDVITVSGDMRPSGKKVEQITVNVREIPSLHSMLPDTPLTLSKLTGQPSLVDTRKNGIRYVFNADTGKIAAYDQNGATQDLHSLSMEIEAFKKELLDPKNRSILEEVFEKIQLHVKPSNILQSFNDKLGKRKNSAKGFRKLLLSILYWLTHPITAALTETVGLLGILEVVENLMGTAAFADPTALSLSVLLILIGIGTVFSLIHGDLWDKSTYKGGWTRGKFLTRFFVRATAGTGFVWLLMLDQGFFWSLSAHLILNAIYLLGASNNWREFDSYKEFSDDATRLITIIQAISAGQIEQVIDSIPEDPIFISEIDGRARVDGQRSFPDRLNDSFSDVRFLSILNNEISQLPSDFKWTDQNQQLLMAVLLAMGLDRSQSERISAQLKADADRVFIFNEKKKKSIVMASLIKAGAIRRKPITILAENDDLSRYYRDIVQQMRSHGFKGKIVVLTHPSAMIDNNEVDPLILEQTVKVQLDSLILILPEGVILGSNLRHNPLSSRLTQLRRNTILFNEFMPVANLTIGNIAERIRAILTAA